MTIAESAETLWIDPFTLLPVRMSRKKWLALRRRRAQQYLINALQRAKEPVE